MLGSIVVCDDHTVATANRARVPTSAVLHVYRERLRGIASIDRAVSAFDRKDFQAFPRRAFPLTEHSRAPNVEQTPEHVQCRDGDGRGVMRDRIAVMRPVCIRAHFSVDMPRESVALFVGESVQIGARETERNGAADSRACARLRRR